MAKSTQIEVSAARELEHIAEQGLLRTPHTIASDQGPDVVIDGKRVACFCSNSYLGLANHPAISETVRVALDNYGFGACASRHISGSMTLHVDLERALAGYVGQDSALLFTTGYAANTGVIPAVTGPTTMVLSDELNHASLVDGCRLSRGRVFVYRHCDAEHVRELLRQHRHEYASLLIVTESVFSMDGDVAPLLALRDLSLEYDGSLFVDEAHALGVRGPQGRGACAELGFTPPLMAGTLGKAFGASGAFVAGPQSVIRLIENRARTYIFSTAPSPVVAAAGLAALEIVKFADERRATLQQHANRVRHALSALGYRVLAGDSPIIPVILGTASATTRFSSRLLELGFFVHGVRPPTVPEGTSRLRLIPTASHSDLHISGLIGAFEQLVPERDGRL